MGELTRCKLFIQNEDGSYSELGHITDMPTITDEIEPSDNSIGFKLDDYSITMTFDRMSNRTIAEMLGWKARGPVRKRVLRKALWMKPYKHPEEIPLCPPCNKENVDEALNELKQAMEEVARIRCET